MDSKDRHLDSKDRHFFSRAFRQALKDLNTDTGMDLICAVCCEYKSKSNCTSVLKLNADDLCKYVVDSEMTRSKDGNLYVCHPCKKNLDSGKEPARAMYEFLGFLDYPAEFLSLIHI